MGVFSIVRVNSLLNTDRRGIKSISLMRLFQAKWTLGGQWYHHDCFLLRQGKTEKHCSHIKTCWWNGPGCLYLLGLIIMTWRNLCTKIKINVGFFSTNCCIDSLDKLVLNNLRQKTSFIVSVQTGNLHLYPLSVPLTCAGSQLQLTQGEGGVQPVYHRVDITSNANKNIRMF